MTHIAYIVSHSHRNIFDQMLDGLFADALPVTLSIIEIPDPGSGVFVDGAVPVETLPTDPRLPTEARRYGCVEASTTGLTIQDLVAQCDRVFFQSLHEANAPLFLSLIGSGAVREAPICVLTDDEVERLYIRQLYLNSGATEAAINKALRHSDALTAAYQALTRAVIPEPFASLLMTLLKRKLDIAPVMLPIVYAPQQGRHRDPDRSARFKQQRVNKVAIYSRSISLETWDLDFLEHLGRQPGAYDGCTVHVFDTPARMADIDQRCRARGAHGLQFSPLPFALPLNAYLRFIEDMDALYLQPRSGVLTIRHAVRCGVPVIANRDYERLHFNLKLLQACGVTVFDSRDQLEDSLRQGALPALLLRNRANLMLHEANAVKKFTELFT